MEFSGFDWDAGNRSKCRKHGVTTGDIESLFTKPVLIIDDPFDATIETRYRAIGRSNSGRLIFVVFTLRGDLIRPISARFMHAKEIERYETDNPEL
jgi:uncharacterized DUF497 family protein